MRNGPLWSPLPIDRLRFLTGRLGRSLWLRPAVYALAAVAALVLGPVLSRSVPERYLTVLAPDALEGLLSILASSLLAVAIFALGTMVQAFQAAAGSATPRARPLLAEDRTAQNAIATFIGAFLFAVLGLVGLALGVFDAGGRLVLFVLTVGLVVVVAVTLVGWLQALASMGGVGDTFALVERATTEAFAGLARSPHHGGRPAQGGPAGGMSVHVDRFGYVQHVDATALEALADEFAADVHLLARPGDWVDPGRPLAVVASAAALPEHVPAAVRRAFTLGRERTFEVDPRYGLRVLAETGLRALSPAVNDPGTAIAVIDTATRALADWRRRAGEIEPEVTHPRLRAPAIDLDAVLEDACGALGREACGSADVAAVLDERLGGLAGLGDAAFTAAVERHRARLRSRARA